LSLSLNGAWGETVARSIWSDESTIYVAGYGDNKSTLRTEALLWTRPIPKVCFADCDQSGILTVDDFICFQTRFALADPEADCDGDAVSTVDDFICFQTLFAIGC
jgi:hypothetical protein